MFNKYRFYHDFNKYGDEMYYASDVDKIKDKIWNLLADISD